MSDEYILEELSQMYEEFKPPKVFDSTLFQLPIKYLRVGKPATVSPGVNVKKAIEIMKEKRVSYLLVVENGKLVGILTEWDLITKVVGKPKAARVTVENIMTPHPEVFQPEDNIAFILNAMHLGGYRHVPVVDEEMVPLAVISVRDIIGFIIDHFPEDIFNLPPHPIRSMDQPEGE